MSRRTRPRRSTRRPFPTGQRARLFLPFRSWRLQLFGATVGIAAAILSAQSFAAAREAAATYVIQPGDTLSAIAVSTGISLDKLVGLNSLANPDLILAGQTLALEGNTAVAPAGPVAPSAGPRYTIKSGDTLWDISVATGAPLDVLISLNDLSNADQLTVGQQLRLPPTAVVQPATTGLIQRAASAPPTRPQATSAPRTSPLQQRLAAEVLRIGGSGVHVGAAATNLTTGERVVLRATETFPSASVMKLPILVELERQIAAGTLAWSESLRAEVGAMIAVSDNGAANQIAAVIHPQSVNDTMSRLGLGGTHFVNLFSDARSATNPGMNQTTPADMAHLLELIATDQIVNPQISADIRTLLSRNVDRSKLVRLLPAEAHVAHKSGWYDGVANDVGIVSLDRANARWVIAVFSENLPDAETGNQIAAAISRAVYDAWAP